ncbi:MAG: AAA family ATPase [Gemmataceae bacterium]|nr:AAA family ATPase [Gemmataceae bacterium]
MIQRLRRLRARGQALGRNLAVDMRRFLHKKDLRTVRRLPSSESAEGDVNVACTCTALMALSVGHSIQQFYDAPGDDGFVSPTLAAFTSVVNAKWKSSKLPEGNAFTSAIVLRAAGILIELPQLKSVAEMKRPAGRKWTGKGLMEIPDKLIRDPAKTLKVLKYPATSTIAYWLVDAVDGLNAPMALDPWRKMAEWASHEFNRQASLVAARHHAMMDPVAMAMAACLISRLGRLAKRNSLDLSGEHFALFPPPVQLRHAIRDLFNLQETSGIWPKYFPLFHYPDAGANYCFSFEMLEAILHEFATEVDGTDAANLFADESILSGFEKAVTWCEQNRFEFATEHGPYYGWNSGGQIETLSRRMPESWATAVVHMFLERLSCSLSKAIQYRVLEQYGVTGFRFQKDVSGWKKLIDSPTCRDGKTVKSILRRHILVDNSDSPDDSPDAMVGQTPEHLPLSGKRSALLFGPPGTSKTSVAKAIAKLVGWPFLEINPAHFLNEGLEKIYVRADEIFEDLMDLSRVVILFDEMDALVQRRTTGGEKVRLDVTRQFLTTSMLPKLAKLYERASVLFFMATNHQEEFDEAIKRSGRFGVLLHLGVPDWKRKVARIDAFWPIPLDEKRDAEEVKAVSAKLEDLTREYSNNDPLAAELDLISFQDMKELLHDIFQLKGESTLGKAIEKLTKDELRQHLENMTESRMTLRKKLDREKYKYNELRTEYDRDKNVTRIHVS